MSSASDGFIQSNAAAWDRAAEKYSADVDRDVDFLRSGGSSLDEHEVRLLGDLADCRRAIHLQCSHGLDTLSLLNLGVADVIGVDISQAMLALAKEKSDRLGVPAQWICCDVLEVPSAFDATADLVYTGKGAVPWVFELDAWASVVARLLQPGGRFFLHEGHPLNWVWERDAAAHRLAPEGRSYFDTEFRANESFPASAVDRFTPSGQARPTAWERQWTLGQVVTALSRVGLTIELLEEHPEHYWPEFRSIASDEEQRLPHSYSLVARTSE